MNAPLQLVPLSPSPLRKLRVRWWRISPFVKKHVAAHIATASLAGWLFWLSFDQTVRAFASPGDVPPAGLVIGIVALLLHFLIFTFFSARSAKALDANRRRLSGENRAITASLEKWMERYRGIAQDQSPMARLERRQLLKAMRFYVSLLDYNERNNVIDGFMREVAVDSPLISE